MSPRSNDEFQVRLSLVQILFLLGVIFGCLVAVYAFGYVAGDSSGYEKAMRSSVKNFIPFAIKEEDKSPEEALKEKTPEIYARLQEDKNGVREKDLLESAPEAAKVVDGKEEEDMPEVAKIEAAEDKPLPLPVEEKEIAPEEQANSEVKEDETLTEDTETSAIAELGKEKEAGENSEETVLIQEDTDQGTSLGSLVAEEKSTDKSVDKSADHAIENSEDAKGSTLSELLAKANPEQEREEALKQATAKIELEKEKTLQERIPSPTPRSIATPVVAAAVIPQVVQQQPPANSGVAPVVPSGATRGWYAQVAAPSTLGEASGLAAKLRSSGFPVRIETASVRGQQYFRILVGPESSQTLAQRLVSQLKREPGIRSEPFVKYVP